MRFRTIFYLLTTSLLLMTCWGSASANAAPEVTNVVATQRVGTHMVDISYDLFDIDGDAMTITIFLSTDGGVSYPFQCTSVTGNTGEGIASGLGLSITWDAGVDFPGFSGSTCSIRVVADDNFVPPEIGLDMFIMLDRTLSMTANNRWDIVTSDLGSFFQDPNSEGISTALSLFPVSGASDQCDPGLYNPPQVALGLLTTYSATLINFMDSEEPGGSTAWSPTLEGTLAAAQARKIAFPENTVIAVFITDGWPALCETSIPVIADLAALAYNSYGVLTYAVGLEGSLGAGLDAIAAAGGTTAAYPAPDTPFVWTIMIAIRDDALTR